MVKFTFSVNFVNSARLSAIVLAYENLQEVFVMWVVFFTSVEVFTFPGYFSFPPALNPSFSDPVKGLHWL